jgi:hypothetical protein
MQLGQQHHVLPPVLGIGDLASDFSQFSSDLFSDPATAFSDSISGLPAWVWLTGGLFVYMFLFGGHTSRVSRAGSATKAAARAAKSAYGGGSSSGSSGKKKRSYSAKKGAWQS